MKKKVLVFLLTSLMVFGLLLTACGGNGGGSGEAASVAGTTWIANMTRTQFAQALVAEGDFGSVAEAEAMLTLMQVPATFPFVRARFAPTGNTVRLDQYDFKDDVWHEDPDGPGTYTQNGNNLRMTVDGEDWTTTIVGGNRFDVTIEEDGFSMTLTFRKQ